LTAPGESRVNAFLTLRHSNSSIFTGTNTASGIIKTKGRNVANIQCCR